MVGKQHEANDEMHGSEHTMSQPYTAFHDTMLPVLDDAMATPGLPSGVLHGDPFLDNMLADPASGELTAIIDWEDIAVGPYVFDVAVCIAGCCFGPDNKIDKNRLKAFLMGYTGTRMLSADERRLLPTFCKLALLCNATWRFRNFQIHHREIDHARESYRELYDRMLDASVADAIETVMGEVASARGVVTAPNSVAMFGGGASSWWVAASLLGCLALGFFIGRRR
jgi:Ser/Thr protein kinase RdoA (MazF antagonist)